MRRMRGADIREYDMILERRIISPRRFVDGGAPILQAEKINHQRVMAGNKVIRPFVDVRLRVCVDS